MFTSISLSSSATKHNCPYYHHDLLLNIMATTSCKRHGFLSLSLTHSQSLSIQQLHSKTPNPSLSPQYKSPSPSDSGLFMLYIAAPPLGLVFNGVLTVLLSLCFNILFLLLFILLFVSPLTLKVLTILF